MTNHPLNSEIADNRCLVTNSIGQITFVKSIGTIDPNLMRRPQAYLREYDYGSEAESTLLKNGTNHGADLHSGQKRY
jgi:hypothetical protein